MERHRSLRQPHPPLLLPVFFPTSTLTQSTGSWRVWEAPTLTLTHPSTPGSFPSKGQDRGGRNWWEIFDTGTKMLTGRKLCVRVKEGMPGWENSLNIWISGFSPRAHQISPEKNLAVRFRGRTSLASKWSGWWKERGADLSGQHSVHTQSVLEATPALSNVPGALQFRGPVLAYWENRTAGFCGVKGEQLPHNRRGEGEMRELPLSTHSLPWSSQVAQW